LAAEKAQDIYWLNIWTFYGQFCPYMDRMCQIMDIRYLHRDNPDYPVSLHTILGEKAPIRIAVRGNPEILKNRMLALFCSVKCPGLLILKTYDLVQELRHIDLTVIGGFHSPMERKCLAILLRGAQPIIVCLARSIERMRLPSEYKKPLTDGRMLLISPFIEKPRRPSTKTTLYRNRLVAALADQVFVAYAEPSGKTESLCSEVVSWRKPLYTLESEHNANTIDLGAKPVTPDSISKVIGNHATT